MKKAIITLMAFGSFFLVGCGTPQPETKDKADSVEDIVGTWRRVGGNSVEYVQYTEDGTFIGCVDELESLGSSSACSGEFWFEGVQYLEKYGEVTGGEGCGLEAGVYDLNLQPNGNIKFVKVEDKRNPRANWRQGRISFGEDDVEWELVP
jgi:hypothetical protein